MTFFVKTLAEAHETAVKKIITGGNHLTTENKEETIELPYSLHILISHPLEQPRISRGFTKYGLRFLTEYTSKVLDITHLKYDGTDPSYTYGNRLRSYDMIDQINGTITKLKDNPNTRRAIMHTWDVKLDFISPEPPCMQTVQLTIRDGKLNMTVYFRSNDMLMAYGANLYALSQLLANMAIQTNTLPGHLETISCCPHIYIERDKDELNEMRRYINV